ncbi:SDR family oxidoreductase [Novilysobacter erysipheiresistens]|uniref:SDR family oxidoreductase n=1 Tax=Novilysobacter erysipheiresistens TaxID=1749332 RepID=A0ABU7YXI9_9GAMM
MPTPPASRRSLVTGANRGLGLEFVHQLLARGDRVIATCRQPGRAHALNQLVGEHPGRLHLLPLDVAAPKSHAELVRELPLVLGDDDTRLDLLINNAGVLHSGERFGKVAAETLDDSLRTNASGPFLLTQALAPWLADGGKVANLSSELGSIAGKDAFRTPSYSISKAALNMATALLARALVERGIVVLALHPGWVQTDMGGSGAEVAPQDAATALLRVIQRADAGDSGRFLDRHGMPMAW